jgi:hypothetical protein
MPRKRSATTPARSRPTTRDSGHASGNRRGNGSSNEHNGGAGSLNRTTIFLPNVMTANLDCLALQIGESKATIVRRALAQFMQTFGYDPYTMPKVTVSHR